MRKTTYNLPAYAVRFLCVLASSEDPYLPEGSRAWRLTALQEKIGVDAEIMQRLLNAFAPYIDCDGFILTPKRSFYDLFYRLRSAGYRVPEGAIYHFLISSR